MEQELKILLAEDLDADFEMAIWEIRKGGIPFQPRRVDNETDFRNALSTFQPDLVISDYSMPGFSGSLALAITMEFDSTLPFIVLTGSMNEETAVECLKKGATDYVLKERIKRLPFAVKEAMARREMLLQKEDTLNKLRESESLLKQAQKIANIGSWDCDFSKNITTASDEAKRIFGVNEDSFTIDKVEAFAMEKYKPLLERILKEHINEGKPYDVEFQIRRKNDGEIRFVHIIAQYDQLSDKLTGIVRDITEKKTNEELRQQILVAKEATRFKQDFLAHMSHEIRTPLTAIEGIVELLQKTQVDEVQRDFLETLVFSSENLKSIINKVLDFSRLEAGKIIIKPIVFSLSEVFDNSRKLFHSICKKDISFSVKADKDLPAFLEADKQRVFQVIINLISNAVKYSDKGEVTLEVQSGESRVDGNKLIKILVHDEGPGIPERLRSRLFKPFSQIHDNVDLKIEGTGLGLSICKELAVLLGGEIGVESRLGEGSTFWFTFAAKPTQQMITVNKPKKTPRILNNKNLHILLAEDKSINQKVISLMLGAMGHRVSIANNGQEALDFCKKQKFDLVLMDIQMPVMDGVTATRHLKKMCDSQIPVVGLSANALEGDREKYMEVGMDDYLTKPVKSEDFEMLMERLEL